MIKLKNLLFEDGDQNNNGYPDGTENGPSSVPAITTNNNTFPKTLTLKDYKGVTYELVLLGKAYWKKGSPAYRTIKPRGLDDVYYMQDIDLENMTINAY